MSKWKKVRDDFWAYKGEQIVAPSSVEIVQENDKYYVMLRQSRARTFEDYGLNEKLGEFDKKENATFYVKDWVKQHQRGRQKSEKVS